VITLRVLGSGDAFGSGGRLQTCLLLEGGDAPVLIDCGASSLIAMKRESIEPNAVEWVLVSHLHGDHFGGVPFLVLDGQFRRRQSPLNIVGPPGTADRLTQTMEVLFPGSSSAGRRFETRVHELSPRERTHFGPFAVTAAEGDHASGAPSYAMRVEYAGTVVTYSGDTAWTPALVDIAAGAEVFVCEAYFFDKRVPYHMDLATLREHRGELTCRRLVLTHMSDDMLDHAGDAGVETAEDGMTLTL